MIVIICLSSHSPLADGGGTQFGSFSHSPSGRLFQNPEHGIQFLV